MSMGYVQNGTYHPVAGGGLVMPVPDWSNAVTVSKAQLGSGYAVPKNGIIVGYFGTNENTQTYMSINGVNVAHSFLVASNTWEGQVQCPVGNGDLVKVEQAAGTGNYSTEIKFVPWKE